MDVQDVWCLIWHMTSTRTIHLLRLQDYCHPRPCLLYCQQAGRSHWFSFVLWL
jgi:hypothetical protein